MQMRLLVASMERVLGSKERPMTPPERVKLVSLAKVQASALKVIVSPEASPMVVLPVLDMLPLIVKAVPTIAWALRPLEMRREPAKELEPAPFDTNSLVRVKSPVKECEAAVSAMKRPDIWRLEEIDALEPKK